MLIIIGVCLGSITFGLGAIYGSMASRKRDDEYIKNRDKILMDLVKDKNDLITELHNEVIKLRDEA